MEPYTIPTKSPAESPCPAIREAMARARALCPFPELLEAELKSGGRITEGGIGGRPTLVRAAKLASLACHAAIEAAKHCADATALAPVRAAACYAGYALSQDNATATAIAAIDALAAANDIISQGRDAELRALWTLTVAELSKLRGAG